MDRYNEVDRRLHLLSQVIAKANRTYVPKSDDDSHTNLYYDSVDDRIVGRWIKMRTGRVMLSLNLHNLEFEWLDERLRLVRKYESIGKRIDEIEVEIESSLDQIVLQSDGFRTKLHFEIPEYTFANENVEQLDQTLLEEWKTLRGLANDACCWALGRLQAESEIRIWPHHFDTGIYAIPNESIGIGFGLAMSDSEDEEPYFYIAGYPTKGALSHDNLPQLTDGEWSISENWSGARLPVSSVSNNGTDLPKDVRSFLNSTIEWYLSQ